MYNNETAGPAFEEFLDLLGQRVRLKGFNKYRAQLDNKSKHLCELELRCLCTRVQIASVACVSVCVGSCVFCECMFTCMCM